MIIIYLLGPANGKVVEGAEFTNLLDGDGLPKVVLRYIGFDEEQGRLWVRYRLYAFDSKEAYYVPEAFSDLQVVKGLIQQQ